MTVRIVLILAFILLAQVPAAAQSDIGFGPQVGIYKAQSADGIWLMGGVALRMKFSDAWGVEGSINYREEKYANNTVAVRSWPVMVSGLFYPIPIAYGAIGAGWFNATIDYTLPAGLPGGSGPFPSETKQQFGWHIGGGVELPLGSVGKLVGDIKYVFLNYRFRNFSGSNGANSDFYIVTVGFLFGL
jgi:opacity protein-like surface antigen